MKSRIYQGEVTHARLAPIKHVFRYPLYFYGFDLSELETLAAQIPWFGYNRVRPVALHDRDYLTSGSGSIREKLQPFLQEFPHPESITRIELITSARYWHYVFNPVSFYYLYREGDVLAGMIAEVNNTFGERHLYLLNPAQATIEGPSYTYRSAKAFHVSPFYDMQGEYEFRAVLHAEGFEMHIHLHRQGSLEFMAALQGQARPLTSRHLAQVLIRYPLSTFLTMPRILWQAAQLYWAKKLPIFPKPPPSSPLTILHAPPSLWQKLCQRIAWRFFANFEHGRLRITLPNGEESSFGQAQPGLDVRMQVYDWEAFEQWVKFGDVGLGESYTARAWDCDDLTALFRLFLENLHVMDDRDLKATWLGRALNRWQHWENRNHEHGSRQNIQFHYDLSNEFFQLLLDDTLTYSSAWFTHPEQSLREAQLHKIHAMIRKARLSADHHLLEIGSGWGTLAIEAVKLTGCRVTTITLSQKQLDLARERIRQAGLQDRITVELCDYRHIRGQFDRIISVEMLESVGHEYLGTFFAACDQLLKPHGLVVLQVITIPDQRYDDYRRGCDWIQKHIFPGGLLPSLTAMTQAMTNDSRLMVEHVENIGIHYARTLREWRENLLRHLEEIRQLGFGQEFQRAWMYYLSYCEAGFATRMLGDLQLVLTRPNNPSLSNFSSL